LYPNEKFFLARCRISSIFSSFVMDQFLLIFSKDAQ